MRFYEIESGARFYWSGRASSYCLKCTWLVAYHLQAQRFAMMVPWSAVGDVEVGHEDQLPDQARIRSAHQQALGLLVFIAILLTALIWFLVATV